MQIQIASMLKIYPQVEEFLGAIVESAQLPNLTPVEKQGMVHELGLLFAQRLTSYLEGALDADSLADLNDVLSGTRDDHDVYARLRSIIPQFDADLERLCVAFHAEYAVGA
jgi:hypothetical protein